ncbi:copal-8-ol diphosphate hydratase, chloroplastic-like isoform X2 [Olea europaea var. sylvestris]|uniref:copal-8-ol diphosphate hydratase, chloroplastic-like isoform X2 n=1 Tax=Olea europaea var. sylvestris TaxID=158386 RepID=UPI000C1CDA82|nr:copal-8-ol diphosphate hydratase, chloroplastic-like isoform X2 [Olea europaea var. sylvestris]
MQALFSHQLAYSSLVSHIKLSSPIQQTLPLQHVTRHFLSGTIDIQVHSLNHNIQDKHLLNVASRDRDINPSQVLEKDGLEEEAVKANEMQDQIECIREMLGTIGEGRMKVSPYDTAWVALVPALDGDDRPQFPGSLRWIADHQLSDGSWGDELVFLSYDRLLNTIACVVALRTWNIHPDKSAKGITFIKENIHKLQDENEDHMLCGFEVVFPALLQKAQNLGIDNIPFDAPIMKEIYAARDRKLKRIPKDLMHNVPTTLLYSLEGLQDLDWEKLLKLQTPLGSFLTSPASTAFALIQTKDEKCFRYLEDIVKEFQGGAPAAYPFDLFARLWAIDRVQRLGISRFFTPQIKDCLDHVYRYWTEDGIFAGRFARFSDVDGSSMGFRLLRLHGYKTTPDVLKQFKNHDKFSCFACQMIESPTPIYNLYRASQVQFPREKILEEAREFSCSFLQERLASNKFLDKWVISKHLPDEIRKGLEMPWYASLPRVEAKYYIEHYGGEDDIWISKTLYRMPDISNNKYLELAKLDFNRCQAQHQREWYFLEEWYVNFKLQELGISKKDLLLAYFLAAANIVEPERSNVRLAWAKSQIIIRLMTFYFTRETNTLEERIDLLSKFKNFKCIGKRKSYKTGRRILDILLKTLDQHSIETLEEHDKDTSHKQHCAWETWLSKLNNEDLEYNDEAELLVHTINTCAGYMVSVDMLQHPEYKKFSKLTNKICHQLKEYQNNKVHEMGNRDKVTHGIKYKEIETDMQALVQLVLEETNEIDSNIKQTFLMVAKTCYYTAFFDQETIGVHISKVIFESV